MKKSKIKLFILTLSVTICWESSVAQYIPDTNSTEVVNGMQVTWASEISEDQKSVLREILENMVKVEGGSFQMGSDGYWKELPIHLNETPIHNETVEDFYINKYELRWSEWKAIMGEENSLGYYWHDSSHYSPQQPMSNFTYVEVLAYISRLNTLTGLNFRLPNEAEWEYAAKGGNHSKEYAYSGSNNPDEVAWYRGDEFDSMYEPSPVGQKLPNELGLYDMCGNVSELVADPYRGDYQSEADDTLRTCRGGDYNKGVMWISNTVRDMYCGDAVPTVGFRLAL